MIITHVFARVCIVLCMCIYEYMYRERDIYI